MTTQDSGSRFTFYFPEARVLSNAAVAGLPPEKNRQLTIPVGEEYGWKSIARTRLVSALKEKSPYRLRA